MPALLPISQIACSWSAEELHASAQAPVVEMFCDADVSPLHDDQAADDSNSDVDQVTFSSAFANYVVNFVFFASLADCSWRRAWKRRSRDKTAMMVMVAAMVAAGACQSCFIAETPLNADATFRRGSRQSGGAETLLVGLQSDEFSYVKPGLLRNWAGLQSWSYRVQSHGIKEGKGKGMRKKEDFILAFDDMTDAEVVAALAQSKVSTTLAASDAKPSGAPFLLPDDIHFKADSLTSM